MVASSRHPAYSNLDLTLLLCGRSESKVALERGFHGFYLAEIRIFVSKSCSGFSTLLHQFVFSP